MSKKYGAGPIVALIIIIAIFAITQSHKDTSRETFLIGSEEISQFYTESQSRAFRQGLTSTEAEKQCSSTTMGDPNIRLFKNSNNALCMIYPAKNEPDTLCTNRGYTQYLGTCREEYGTTTVTKPETPQISADKSCSKAGQDYNDVEYVCRFIGNTRGYNTRCVWASSTTGNCIASCSGFVPCQSCIEYMNQKIPANTCPLGDGDYTNEDIEQEGPVATQKKYSNIGGVCVESSTGKYDTLQDCQASIGVWCYVHASNNCVSLSVIDGQEACNNLNGELYFSESSCNSVKETSAGMPLPQIQSFTISNSGLYNSGEQVSFDAIIKNYGGADKPVYLEVGIYGGESRIKQGLTRSGLLDFLIYTPPEKATACNPNEEAVKQHSVKAYSLNYARCIPFQGCEIKVSDKIVVPYNGQTTNLGSNYDPEGKYVIIARLYDQCWRSDFEKPSAYYQSGTSDVTRRENINVRVKGAITDLGINTLGKLCDKNSDCSTSESCRKTGEYYSIFHIIPISPIKRCTLSDDQSIYIELTDNGDGPVTVVNTDTGIITVDGEVVDTIKELPQDTQDSMICCYNPSYQIGVGSGECTYHYVAAWKNNGCPTTHPNTASTLSECDSPKTFTCNAGKDIHTKKEAEDKITEETGEDEGKEVCCKSILGGTPQLYDVECPKIVDTISLYTKVSLSECEKTTPTEDTSADEGIIYQKGISAARIRTSTASTLVESSCITGLCEEGSTCTSLDSLIADGIITSEKANSVLVNINKPENKAGCKAALNILGIVSLTPTVNLLQPFCKSTILGGKIGGLVSKYFTAAENDEITEVGLCVIDKEPFDILQWVKTNILGNPDAKDTTATIVLIIGVITILVILGFLLKPQR